MRRQSMLKMAAWAGALLALLGVFTLYLQPDFMLTLANQVWVCF
ncbi:MAG: hypothetical protein V4772_12065 [Pseudomonadota bacterium]